MEQFGPSDEAFLIYAASLKQVQIQGIFGFSADSNNLVRQADGKVDPDQVGGQGFGGPAQLGIGLAGPALAAALAALMRPPVNTGQIMFSWDFTKVSS